MAKKSSAELFKSFKETGLIEAVFLFKRQMNRTANLFMHWALVLKGQNYYHLVEFGPHGINYAYYQNLHDCAKNMMGDHSKVYAWKVKRLRSYTILGFSVSNLFNRNDDDPYDFKPNNFSFDELHKFLKEELFFIWYDLIMSNCQVFSKILIFRIRRDKTLWLPQQHMPKIMTHYAIETNLELSTGYDYQFDVK